MRRTFSAEEKANLNLKQNLSLKMDNLGIYGQIKTVYPSEYYLIGDDQGANKHQMLNVL